MDQQKEDLIRRPLYVFDLPQDILGTLQRRAETGTESNELIDADSRKPDPKDDQRDPNTGGSKACSLCNVAFHTVEDQRSHIRSDLHRYNLKQKLRGQQPVLEEEFERLVGDLDESLSGSDSSESEEEDDRGSRKETTLSALFKKQATITGGSSGNIDNFSPKKRKRGSGKPPLLWFTTPAALSNIYLGIYRAIFTNSELENESQILDTIRNKQLSAKPVSKPNKDTSNGVPLPAEYKGPHIFLCMIGGGHFAAMVVSLAPKQTKSSATGPLAREATVLAHKTYHRYTTRRKQGGAQSANDSAKGAAHSAGSSLRRHNEAALTGEVRLLLLDWKWMIDTSELLFIRAIGNTNRRTLFGPYDGQVLRQSDPRIRGFPFSTRRATQQELMRSFVELTRVKVQEIDEAAIAAAAAAVEETSRQAPIADTRKQSSLAPAKRSEEEETALLHTTQIQALIRRSKLPALLTYLRTNNLSSDFLFYPQDSQQNYHASTSLHLAASLNSPTVVSGLLTKADANPLLLNGDGKLAFDLAGDRTTRDAFRVARSHLGEDCWDWDAAHVPSALSKSEADERDARERQEISRKEEGRRKAEAERLKQEGPKLGDSGPLGKAAGRGRALALGLGQKTAQEMREEETRGLSPEMRARLERERRARAAEERIRRLQSSG